MKKAFEILLTIPNRLIMVAVLCCLFRISYNNQEKG